MTARIVNLTRHYADGFELKDELSISEKVRLMKDRPPAGLVRVAWECDGKNFELSALNPKRGDQPLSVSLLPDASGLICFERNRMANNAYILDPDGKMRYRLVVPWELTGRDIPATSEMWFSHVAVHEDGEFGLNAWIEGTGSGGYSEGDWYFELDYRTGRFLWGKEIRI